MKRFKILMAMILPMCFFSNLAINAMEDGEKQKNITNNIENKSNYVTEYLFRETFGSRKGTNLYNLIDSEYYLKSDLVENINIEFWERIICRIKDYADIYLNEYLELLLSYLNNSVCCGKYHQRCMVDYSLNRLWLNIVNLVDEEEKIFKEFIEKFIDNDRNYKFVTEKHIDEIIELKHHIKIIGRDIAIRCEPKFEYKIGEELEEEFLKYKIKEIYKQIKEKFNVNEESYEKIKESFEKNYEGTMKIIKESIVFDESLKEGQIPKNKKNIKKTMENLYKSRKAILVFIDRAIMEVQRLQQYRKIDASLYGSFGKIKSFVCSDDSDLINFIPDYKELNEELNEGLE